MCATIFCFAFVFPGNFFKDNVFFSKEDKRFDSSNDKLLMKRTNPCSLPACLITSASSWLGFLPPEGTKLLAQSVALREAVSQLPLPGVSADGWAGCTV